MSEFNQLTQADVLALHEGKRLPGGRAYREETVPAGTSVVICAFTIDDLTNADAVLTALGNAAPVGTCVEVARKQIPDWTVPGCQWRVGIEANLRYHKIPQPEPE